MKIAHNLVFSVFEKEEDNRDSVERVFHSFLPLDFEKEKIMIIRKEASTVESGDITIVELVLSKERHIRVFINALRSRLSNEQKTLLLRQARSRLDSQFNFYMRLDKKSLLEGVSMITDEGNCFHLKINLALFPKGMDAAKKLLEEIFK